MQAVPLPLKGLLLLETSRFQDERGYFTERFKLEAWQKILPKHPGFIQDNYSWSNPGVLRGLHYQLGPDQGKLVTCMRGRIFDVAVDIRKASRTFGQSFTIELSEEKSQWLWIPAGFAHGFLALTGAAVLYKVDCPYRPEAEGSIAWNDPELKISWPAMEPVLSEKDRQAPSLAQYLNGKSTY